MQPFLEYLCDQCTFTIIQIYLGVCKGTGRFQNISIGWCRVIFWGWIIGNGRVMDGEYSLYIEEGLFFMFYSRGLPADGIIYNRRK
jgi:hypothetical protein